MAEQETTIRLDEAALAIAAGEYPDLDQERYIGRLDAMAARLRPRISPEESAERQVSVLNTYLFGEESFHGNTADYFDPRNSYLNEVLERRTGIPITLSLIYIELGRRVGLRLEGVGMPGHFLVRCLDARDELLIDPFNQGAVLTLADCEARLAELYGNSLRFRPELLRTSGRREIVARMLANLKGSYLRRGDLARALRAVDWSLVVYPGEREGLRERGLLRYRLGDLRGAIGDLGQYLEAYPRGRLADQTREHLSRVEELWTRRN